MKKLTDEQIQAMLEIELRAPADTLSAPEDEQVQRYQSLFQKLNREPEQGLPFNFASKVTGRLKIKLKRRSDIRFNLLALLGIGVGLLLVYALLTVVDLTAGNQFLLSMLKFKWLLILGTAVLLGSLMFEQNVVEKNQGI
ncbi:hypothetical protein [Mucilaginibacter psychrotolerans]|uniref:Uncharacterized protein n=1 Tax=Mucilaginibacter psychrotolerans TaxID=1524096 RepID=A0A4Y8S8L2_9SPHI|nr:hypothetical protein [Mucilaginibacter psychrotolerans]TFF35369.1 hypothetical protein E2R66_19120 [Mucilaginibacter psychrotolerans]